MWDWIAKASELEKTLEPFALITIARVSGSAPRNTGTKMILTSTGEFFGTIGGGQLESLVLLDAKSCLQKKESGYFSYPLGPRAQQCCGGLVETLVEIVNERPELFIFGAGHVGQAVAQVFQGTAFKVTLIDEREAWIESPEIPKYTECYFGDYKKFLVSRHFKPELSYFVVMTHSHDLDQNILVALNKIECAYVGLIGSDSKWNRFQHRLAQAGLSEAEISKIQSPIGERIGKAPKEVAISLAFELLSHLKPSRTFEKNQNKIFFEKNVRTESLERSF